MACTSKLSAPLNNGCPAPSRGYEQKAWIGNWDDIATKTYDATTGICSALTLNAAYTYPVYIKGVKPYDMTKSTAVMKNFGVTFDAETEIKLVGNTPANAAVVSAMAKGKFFLILEQIGKKDNADQSKYQIVGLEAGLNMSAGVLEPYGDNGAWSVSLKEEMNQAPALFMYVTSAAATDTWVKTTLGNNA